MAEKIFYAIVTQFDVPTESQFAPSGPILHERTLHQSAASSEPLTEQMLARFKGYGWARVAKVIVDIPEGES